MSLDRKLNREGRFRVIAALHRDAFEKSALRSAILELWSELLKPDKMLINIFILECRSVKGEIGCVNKVTSVYWPGTSISSTLVYWNSVR